MISRACLRRLSAAGSTSTHSWLLKFEGQHRFCQRLRQPINNGFWVKLNHSKVPITPDSSVMCDTRKLRLAQRVRRFLRPRTARRFARRQEGSAAVEFGLVLLPFLALMFAIIETALMFFAQQTLETVTANAARLILTGQAQAQSQSWFQTQLCKQVVALFNCATGISINVQTFSSFSSVTQPSYIKNGQFQPNTLVYQPGGPGDIVVVQVLYQWPIFVNLMGLNLGNLGNNSRLLIATAAFRNEPYSASSN
jgi:Flp pilus assembly protein TadG